MLKDWALVPTWCQPSAALAFKSTNAAEENQCDDSSEPYLCGRRNKKAALPVMMEARPGGEEGDRSVLEGSGPDLGWPLDWRLGRLIGH
jgi:hypothetical protein